MTETRATAPVFPPGRYGRRREPHHRRWGTAAVAVLMLGVSLLVAISLFRQYGNPTYSGQVTRYYNLTETGLTVDVVARMPPGGRARCLLRARAYDGSEVGRQEVAIAAAAGVDQAAVSASLPTTGRAVYADVIRCRAAG